MKKLFILHDYSENMKAKVAIFSLKGKEDIWWENVKCVRGIKVEEMKPQNKSKKTNGKPTTPWLSKKWQGKPRTTINPGNPPCQWHHITKETHAYTLHPKISKEITHAPYYMQSKIVVMLHNIFSRLLHFPVTCLEVPATWTLYSILIHVYNSHPS